MKLFSPALALSFFVSLSLASASFAQQPPTISSNVKVVDVVATVRDKKGNVVKSLTKDDFKIEEDGKAQTVRYFRQDYDLPLTLGLLVDTSLSQRLVIDQERAASGTFLDRMLRNQDQAFLIHFDHEVELLQDVTSSREKLRRGLEELQTPQLHRVYDPNDPHPQGGRSNDPQDRRRGGIGQNGGTALYDAVFLSADEVMSKQKERKAIIILSDGVDHGSRVSLERAIESAQRSNVVVYSIYYTGEDYRTFSDHDGGGGHHHGGIGFPGGGYPGGGGGGRRSQEHVDGKKILERVSSETGGRMFEVSKKEPVDKIYAQIEDDLRNQYSLGYTPEHWTSGYHSLKISTSKKDMKVQARLGYYAD